MTNNFVMNLLLEELSRSHFPRKPASESLISKFEAKRGWRLDGDLRTFYLHCNGASLFRERFAPYRLLPLDELVRTRIAIYGRDEDAWGPSSWFVVCDMGDSNYVSIDAQTLEADRYPLFDCFHETFRNPGECSRVADSFAGFLKRALDSQGNTYWL